MLTIRFQRVGRKNDPAFRIVLTEKRSKPKSGELEILGSFHPKTRETQLKSERILYWLSKGAKTSPRVHNLLVSKNIFSAKKINVSRRLAAGVGADPVRSKTPTVPVSQPQAERTSNGVDHVRDKAPSASAAPSVRVSNGIDAVESSVPVKPATESDAPLTAGA